MAATVALVGVSLGASAGAAQAVSDTGLLEGTITASDGTVIPSEHHDGFMEVQIYPVVDGVVQQGSDNRVFDVLTDDSGHFGSTLPFGDYAVLLLPTTYSGQQFHRGWLTATNAVSLQSANAKAFTIGASNLRTTLGLTLSGVPAVAGTVVSAPGAPVAGVTVDLLENGSVVASATTKDDGSYFLSNDSASSNYTVHFVAPADSGLESQWWYGSATEADASPLTLDVDQVTHLGETTLTAPAPIPTGTISGVLQSGTTGYALDLADGTPVVHATDSTGTVFDGEVDADGKYSIDQLSLGDYIVSVTVTPIGDGPVFYPAYWNPKTFEVVRTAAEAAPITLTANSPTWPLNLRIVSEPRLRGTVQTVGGGAAEGITVTLFDESNAAVETATTDADGSYSISIAAPAGQASAYQQAYTLKFSDPSGDLATQWYGNALSADFSDIVSGPYDGLITDLHNTTLSPATSISGTVTDGSGNPIVGLTVTARNHDGQTVKVTTGADGTYRFDGVPADVYTVTFAGAGVSSAEQSADTTGGDVSDLDQQLTGAGVISGTVTGANGYSFKEGEWVTVSALDAEGTQIGFDVALEGNYSIHDLPFGTYTVRFDPQDPNTRGFAQVVHSVPVTVSKSTPEVTVNEVLPIGGRITGTLTTQKNADGDAEGMSVVATAITGPADRYVLADTFTKLKTSYTITGLPTGTYKVEFQPNDPNEFADTWWKGAFSAATATTVTVKAGVTTSGINGTALKPVKAAALYLKAKVAYATSVGQTLAIYTRSGSKSVPAKVTTTYQWFRIDADGETPIKIAKATGSTYKPVNADAGQHIGVHVTQQATGYAPTVTYLVDPNLVGNAKFTKVPKVTISGTAATGHAIAAKLSGLFSPAPDAIDYFWTDNGLRIPDSWGGKSSSVFLGWDDLGHGNPYDTGKGNNPPSDWLVASANSHSPQDAGNAVGDPASHDYPFELTQLLQPLFNGAKMTVQVCATKEFYATSCKTVKVTVAKDLSKRVIPTISKSGSVWTASADTWHSTTYIKGTVALRYQWLRDGAPIAGATKRSYTVGSSDSGTHVTVRVTGTAKGYTTAQLVSLNTGVAP